MPTTIEVKTQRIVVNPPSGRVDVYGYGPAGPVGPQGPPGSGVVVAWPVVAPPTVDGHIQFTPSNTNIAGLRPSTDANSWIRFWAGPPNSIYIKANSGPLTSGRMGEIYLDADATMLRSSNAGTLLATFAASAISLYPAVYLGATLNVPGHTTAATLTASGQIRAASMVSGSFMFAEGGDDTGFAWISDGSFHIRANNQNVAIVQTNGIVMQTGKTLYFTQNTSDGVHDGLGQNWFRPRDPSGNVHIMAGVGEMFLDSTTIHLRHSNATQYGYINNSGFLTNGTRGFHFGDYGGGWFMQDGTWIRSLSDKSVWIGGGTYGTDGYLSIGNGGLVPDGGQRIYVNGNIFTTSNMGAYSIEARSITNDNWSGMQALRVNPGATTAGLVMHPGGVACVLRQNGGDDRLHVFNSQCTAWIPVCASAFTVVSSLKYKTDVIDLPVHRPVDVARSLTPIWFRGVHDLLEPIPINDEHGNLIGSDFTQHNCDESIHCNGTMENPCQRMAAYRRGKLSLSAEQVEEIFPVISQYSTEGELMGYDMTGLVALLVGAIRNLADDVDYLKGLVA